MIKSHILNLLLKIKRTDYTHEYEEVRKIKNKDDLYTFQQKKLKDLLIHAYKNVPYYTKVLRDTKIVKDESVDLSRFNRIPILTKEILKKYNTELISTDLSNRKWFFSSSGGSTGEPVQFIKDQDYRKWKDATLKYYYQEILGIDEPAAKKILLWGSDPSLSIGTIDFKTKIHHWLTNTKLLNSFKMTRQDLENYIRIINEYKPDLVRGYASSLYELSRYASNKKLSVYRPKILISSAETLEEEMRSKIEENFGTKVYDFYGSTETASLAGECTSNLKHIFSFNNYVEVLDDDNNPVIEGKTGRIIVTNLHNYSMPFIRFEIGDMAILGPKNCTCGNYLPTLKSISGRKTDYFIKTDGTLIRIPNTIFLYKNWIKNFQIIQEGYNKIKILIVPDKDSHVSKNKSEINQITNNIQLLMGQSCKIIWEFVDEIPTTKSGKHLYRKSLIYK